MALGQKTGKNNVEADKVAWIRTLIVLVNTGIGLFNACVGIAIVAGIIKHWND